jgi:hypothetical protein
MDFEQEVQRLTFDRDMRNEVRHLIRTAVAAEREACAKIVERNARTPIMLAVAASIRARSA